MPDKPVHYVSDFGGALEKAAESEINGRLSALEGRTSEEIAVVTVISLDGKPVETYAKELFRKWGVGKEGKDNGLLLLIAIEERKVRIEVGYGLEGKISDGAAGAVIRDHMVPYLRAGDTAGAVRAGTLRLEELLSLGPPRTVYPPGSSFWRLWLEDVKEGHRFPPIVGDSIGTYLFFSTLPFIVGIAFLHHAWTQRRRLGWLSIANLSFGGLALFAPFGYLISILTGGIAQGLELAALFILGAAGIIGGGAVLLRRMERSNIRLQGGQGDKLRRDSRSISPSRSNRETWGGGGFGSSSAAGSGGGFGGFGGGRSGGGGATGSW